MPSKKKFALLQVSLKILLRRGNRVLLLWNENGEIDLPGGRIDIGEETLSLEQILAREIREELGENVRYTIKQPAFQFKVFGRKSKRYSLNTVYEATYQGGTIELSEEHKRYKWVEPGSYRIRKQDIRDQEKLTAFERYFRSLQKDARGYQS